VVISQVAHYLAKKSEYTRVIVLTPNGVLTKQLVNSYFSQTAPNKSKITHVVASEEDLIKKFFNMPDSEIKTTAVVLDEVDNFVL